MARKASIDMEGERKPFVARWRRSPVYSGSSKGKRETKINEHKKKKDKR